MNTFESVAQEHRELDAAIGLDPNFALAYANKSILYSAELTTNLEDVEITAESQRRSAELTREYAERALAIDPDQGIAYMSLGLVDDYERRWAQRSANIEKSYQLSPANAVVVTTYAFNLTQRGLVDEALPIYQRGFSGACIEGDA
jgi:tetratricopeptide (TPR) repeat protein